jgi:hypothetical protein
MAGATKFWRRLVGFELLKMAAPSRLVAHFDVGLRGWR